MADGLCAIPPPVVIGANIPESRCTPLAPPPLNAHRFDGDRRHYDELDSPAAAGKPVQIL